VRPPRWAPAAAGGSAAGGAGAGLIKCFGGERNPLGRRGPAISTSAINEKFSSAFSFFFFFNHYCLQKQSAFGEFKGLWVH